MRTECSACTFTPCRGVDQKDGVDMRDEGLLGRLACARSAVVSHRLLLRRHTEAQDELVPVQCRFPQHG